MACLRPFFHEAYFSGVKVVSNSWTGLRNRIRFSANPRVLVARPSGRGTDVTATIGITAVRVRKAVRRSLLIMVSEMKEVFVDQSETAWAIDQSG